MQRLLIAIFFFPAFVIGQKIPSKANAIILNHLQKRQLLQILAKEGFTVVEKDSSSLETLPRQYKELESGNLIIRARVVDTTVVLTGSFNQVANQTIGNPYGNRWQPAVHTALWGNSKAAFEIMDRLAHALSGQISYAKL